MRQDARARFGDAPDLEDLVQEALVLLWKRRDEVAKPRAWVHATIWRLLANRRRTARDRAALIPRYRSNDREVADAEEALELRIGLTEAARHLTSAEQRILALLSQGLGQGEIADRLDIGWKSVGARVQRLRRKLRVLLGESPKQT